MMYIVVPLFAIVTSKHWWRTNFCRLGQLGKTKCFTRKTLVGANRVRIHFLCVKPIVLRVKPIVLRVKPIVLRIKPFVLRVKQKYYYILMYCFTRKVNCFTRKDKCFTRKTLDK